MVNPPKRQIMTLCVFCAERFRDAYILNPVQGSAQRGKCEWCRKPSAEVEQYEYRSKREAEDAARRAAHEAKAGSAYGRRDTRARYRGRWREDM